jgi:hypothetical protein
MKGRPGVCSKVLKTVITFLEKLGISNHEKILENGIRFSHEISDEMYGIRG